MCIIITLLHTSDSEKICSCGMLFPIIALHPQGVVCELFVHGDMYSSIDHWTEVGVSQLLHRYNIIFILCLLLIFLFSIRKYKVNSGKRGSPESKVSTS